MEKKYLNKIHILNDSIKKLKDNYASESSMLYEKMQFIEQQNKQLEESLETERDQRLNDEAEDQATRLQLNNTVENQLFVITELKYQYEILQENVDSFEPVMKAKDEKIQSFEDRADQDTLAMDLLSSELRVARKTEAQLRSQLAKVNNEGTELESGRYHADSHDTDQLLTIAQLKEIIENQKGSINDLKDENEDLQKTIESFESEIDSKHGSVSSPKQIVEERKPDVEVLLHERVSRDGLNAEGVKVGSGKEDDNIINIESVCENLQESIQGPEEGTAALAGSLMVAESNEAVVQLEGGDEARSRCAADSGSDSGSGSGSGSSHQEEQQRDPGWGCTEHRTEEVFLCGDACVVNIPPPAPLSCGRNIPPVASDKKEMHTAPASTSPVILVDIGSFTSHVGVWNTEEEHFDVRYFIISIVYKMQTS
jgi:hypothetical protein